MFSVEALIFPDPTLLSIHSSVGRELPLKIEGKKVIEYLSLLLIYFQFSSIAYQGNDTFFDFHYRVVEEPSIQAGSVPAELFVEEEERAERRFQCPYKILSLRNDSVNVVDKKSESTELAIGMPGSA
ncbi:hypothetical protein TURU_038918 [Turdus rufiventris]|nr:hypothetical protein TURU_038918 [Turdus rufiventris]